MPNYYEKPSLYAGLTLYRYSYDHAPSRTDTRFQTDTGTDTRNFPPSFASGTFPPGRPLISVRDARFLPGQARPCPGVVLMTARSSVGRQARNIFPLIPELTRLTKPLPCRKRIVDFCRFIICISSPRRNRELQMLAECAKLPLAHFDPCKIRSSSATAPELLQRRLLTVRRMYEFVYG